MVLRKKLSVYVNKIWVLVEDQQDNQRSISLAKGYWDTSSKINLELDLFKDLINGRGSDLVESMEMF